MTMTDPMHPFRGSAAARPPCERGPRRPRLKPLALLLLSAALPLPGCDRNTQPAIGPLPRLQGGGSVAAPRVNGTIGTTDENGRPLVSYGRNRVPQVGRGAAMTSAGTISLDFADTDVRDAVAQILGTILHANYTIDPAVKGTVTLHTATPLAPEQLVPTLQALLSQVGATLYQAGALYRITTVGVVQGGGPGGAAGGGSGGPSPALAGSESLAGSAMVALHFAGAQDLAKALQPFVQSGARIAPVAGANALLVSGDPAVRNTLISLIQAFDIDALAGQSYALLPVDSGDAKDIGDALKEALRGRGGALSEVVRVVPMSRVNAVLVVASDSRYIDDARRLFGLVERARRNSVRSWHVYYLQNSHANDAAYVLQQAFTPNNVTAQPTQAPQANIPGSGQSGFGSGLSSGSGGSSGFGSGLTGSTGLGGGLGGSSSGSLTSGTSSQNGTGQTNTQPTANSQAANANPLMGGLDSSAGGSSDARAMRIIPNPQNNALLIYATDEENDTVNQMLRKIDILPLQVRIDAVIAEVQLNDNLRYGTQFFFKSGGINGVLSSNSQTLTTGTLATAAFSDTLPGFVIGGASGGGAPFAINALQDVTTVHVLSSPELLVLDNQPARLQVGQLVPIQTGASTSTLSTGQVFNQYTYEPTGVIMQVTPRVNNGGLVTLDVSQEVSSVNGTSTSSTNPTFNDRSVTSRVVVQDGQTIGLAGLITDTSTRDNSGIPWLKDIPVLGALAGNQNNTRQRTELLVLITPHVMHDQHDAQALTEDMRDNLVNAAAVPYELGPMRATGSADPQARVRRSVGLGP